jgi:hypothetical protein
MRLIVSGEVFIPGLNTGSSLKRHPSGFRKRTMLCLCKEFRNYEGVADTGIPTLIPTQEGLSPIQGSNDPYRLTNDCFNRIVFGEIDFRDKPEIMAPLFLSRRIIRQSPYHVVDTVNGDCRTTWLINCKQLIF